MKKKKRKAPRLPEQYAVGRREDGFCWLLPKVPDETADDRNLEAARRFSSLTEAISASIIHGGNVFELIADEQGGEGLEEIMVDLELERNAPYEGCYRVLIDELIAGPTFVCPEEATTQSRVMALAKANVRCIVTLANRAELFSMREQLDATQFGELFEQHYFPLVDGEAPSPDFMRLILDTVDRALDAGETVFVHCIGGRGRTGTVIGCFLARHGVGMGTSALNALTKIRMQHGLFEPSPETEAQRQLIVEWKEGE
jgi:protein-tyrosine phosphatase